MRAIPQYVLKRSDGRFFSRADGWSDLAAARIFSPDAALAVLNALDELQLGCIPMRVKVVGGVPMLIRRVAAARIAA